MLAVLRRRDFSLLWFGGVLSVTGDLFLFIALPFFVYERTGSVLATGAMFAAETLPRLLFGSVAGVFVDRWDRKRTMVFADLSRAVVLLPLLAVAAGGPLALVYAVAFVEATVSMFFLPAKGAIIPNLVAERDLTAANSLNSIGEEVPSLVGPLLGGALLGVVGLSGLILLDIATYLASALLISLLRAPTAAPEEEPEVTPEVAVSAWANALKEWLGGLRLIGRDRSVAVLLAVISVAKVPVASYRTRSLRPKRGVLPPVDFASWLCLLVRGKGPSVSDEEAPDASPNETSSAVLRESARLQVAEKTASRVVR